MLLEMWNFALFDGGDNGESSGMRKWAAADPPTAHCCTLLPGIKDFNCGEIFHIFWTQCDSFSLERFHFIEYTCWNYPCSVWFLHHINNIKVKYRTYANNALICLRLGWISMEVGVNKTSEWIMDGVGGEGGGARRNATGSVTQAEPHAQPSETAQGRKPRH